MIYIELPTFLLSIYLLITLVSSSHKNLTEMEKIINTELKTVACWLSANKLSLNISKSSFLIFHPPEKAVKKINLKIYDNNILEKANT